VQIIFNCLRLEWGLLYIELPWTRQCNFSSHNNFLNRWTVNEILTKQITLRMELFNFSIIFDRSFGNQRLKSHWRILLCTLLDHYIQRLLCVGIAPTAAVLGLRTLSGFYVFHTHTHTHTHEWTLRLNVFVLSLKCGKALTDLGPLGKSILNLSTVCWSKVPDKLVSFTFASLDANILCFHRTHQLRWRSSLASTTA